jgi:hypothetical protein
MPMNCFKRLCAGIFVQTEAVLIVPIFFKTPYCCLTHQYGADCALKRRQHPVVLEGVHCAGIIPYLKKEDRNIVVRLQNDEAVYYRRLAETESNFFKSSYYRRESRLLKKYQHTLPKSSGTLPYRNGI